MSLVCRNKNYLKCQSVMGEKVVLQFVARFHGTKNVEDGKSFGEAVALSPRIEPATCYFLTFAENEIKCIR